MSTKLATRLWALGFAGAALVQGLTPRDFAEHSHWGRSPWQREIAIWNVGTVAAIAGVQSHPEDPDKGLLQGFMLMSSLFGVNHLIALVRAEAGHRRSHVAGVLANAAGLAIGAAALARRSG